MKKITLIALLISSITFAQNFVVTPGGLKAVSDESKDFVVLEVTGKTAKELYQNAQKYIQKTYKNPQEVVKGQVEAEYLRFDTHADKAFYWNAGMGFKEYYDINYTTQVDFKDGKVKVSFQNITFKSEKPKGAAFGWIHENSMSSPGIFDKKGVRQPDAKKLIELYFNDQADQILKGLKDSSAEEKW